MQTLQKTERLRSRKTIERLFSHGQTLNNHPIRLFWLETQFNSPFPAKVLISVSKKGFKRAVDRNYVKRRIREAYRKNKHILYNYLDENQVSCAFGIIFTGKEIINYKDIEQKIIDSLERFIKEHEKNTR